MPVFRTFSVIRWMFPTLTWRIPTKEKVLYLTFDDGPIPEVTEWVLTELAKYNAKATFFCIGDNIRKHPETFAQVQACGHAIGNHTFNHLRGWDTGTKRYLQNIADCEQYFDTKLFRPPYGRITRPQFKSLHRKGYNIFMWDVLTWDFDKYLPVNWSMRRIVKAARPGSIVVFHDSLKAKKKLQEFLPYCLAEWQKKGYRFEALK